METVVSSRAARANGNVSNTRQTAMSDPTPANRRRSCTHVLGWRRHNPQASRTTGSNSVHHAYTSVPLSRVCAPIQTTADSKATPHGAIHTGQNLCQRAGAASIAKPMPQNRMCNSSPNETSR